MKGLKQPHDKFFKALTEDLGAASALFRERLPRELVAQLADARPELVDGSFVDDELREAISDRIFKLKLRGKGEAFVNCVLEHKSAPEPRVALQTLGYMVRGWERVARTCRTTAKLPPVIPLVVYHGAAPWKVAPRFSALVRPCSLGVKPLDFEMVLVDLENIDDGDLSRDPTLRAGLLALKYATRGTMQRSRFGGVLEALSRAPSLLHPGLLYMMETYQRIDRPSLFEEAGRAMPEHKERIMTIAQELRKEGRRKGLEEGLKKGAREGLREGLAEGEKKGRVEALLRVLARRFGSVPKATRARVLAAKDSDLDGWLDRAIDAPTLDAVFGAAH